jgi:hypothetical protein
MEPERKDKLQEHVPDGINQREEEVSKETVALVSEIGGQTVPSQITAQVVDDNGQQMMQSPATQVVTITIPATQQQLADWTKGSATDSLTWLATFWVRLIKKAIHFGWRVVMKKGVA